MNKFGMPAAAAAMAMAMAMALVCVVPGAQAGEGGGSSHPGGLENFLTGAAPPPGFHVLEYDNVVLHAIAPLVDLKVTVLGLSQRKTGLADIPFGPGLAFHHSPNPHSVVGFDFVAPVGRCSALWIETILPI